MPLCILPCIIRSEIKAVRSWLPVFRSFDRTQCHANGKIESDFSSLMQFVNSANGELIMILLIIWIPHTEQKKVNHP